MKETPTRAEVQTPHCDLNLLQLVPAAPMDEPNVEDNLSYGDNKEYDMLFFAL